MRGTSRPLKARFRGTTRLARVLSPSFSFSFSFSSFAVSRADGSLFKGRLKCRRDSARSLDRATCRLTFAENGVIRVSAARGFYLWRMRNCSFYRGSETIIV